MSGAPEDAEVLALCQKWGFGAVLSSANRQWRERDPSGAISLGPCEHVTVWGKIYRKWVAKGADHCDAAYRADLAEARAQRRRGRSLASKEEGRL